MTGLNSWLSTASRYNITKYLESFYVLSRTNLVNNLKILKNEHKIPKGNHKKKLLQTFRPELFFFFCHKICNLIASKKTGYKKFSHRIF